MEYFLLLLANQPQRQNQKKSKEVCSAIHHHLAHHYLVITTALQVDYFQLVIINLLIQVAVDCSLLIRSKIVNLYLETKPLIFLEVIKNQHRLNNHHFSVNLSLFLVEIISHSKKVAVSLVRNQIMLIAAAYLEIITIVNHLENQIRLDYLVDLNLLKVVVYLVVQNLLKVVDFSVEQNLLKVVVFLVETFLRKKEAFLETQL